MLAVLALSGCQEPTPEPTPAPSLTLSTDTISVSNEAADVTVSVTADGDWGVYPADKSWVSVTPGGGAAGTSDILVKIAENTTGDARQTELVFTTKGGKVTLPVKQNYRIDEVEISDPAFKAYLLKAYDVDKDGVISTKEAAAVTRIDAPEKGIKTMPELNEHFNKISYLDCSDNQLK